MATLSPPGWLMAYTGICFVVFFAFGGASIFSTVPNYEPGTNVNGFLEFIGDVFEFLTFNLGDVGIELPLFVRAFLFLTCTLPWLFVLVGAIIEATKALGSLIPFTAVMVLLAFPGAMAASGTYATFEPTGPDMWQVGDTTRVCATEALTGNGLATVTPPTATPYTITPDSEDCFALEMAESGSWSLNWTVAGPANRVINFEAQEPATIDWNFYINLGLALAMLGVGFAYRATWFVGFGIVATLAATFPSISASLGWTIGHTIVWGILGAGIQYKWETKQA